MPSIPRRAALATLASWSLAAGGLAACSGRARPAGTGPEPAIIVFENQSQYDAGVYLVPRGGTQQRIGTVPPGRTDRLRVRSNLLPPGGQVVIVARLLAVRGSGPGSGPLTLNPGDRIRVTLPLQANTLVVLPVNEDP